MATGGHTAIAQVTQLPVRTLGLGSISTAAYSRDLQYTAFAHANLVYILKTDEWSVAYTLEEHTDSVTSVAFSSDGRILASGALDNTVRLWEVATGQEIRCLQGQGERINFVAFSPNGELLASSGHGGIQLWDVSTGQEIRSLAEPEGAGFIAFNPDGSMLASCMNQRVQLWDVSTGQEIRSLTGAGSRIAFSPDGSTIALAGGADDRVRLWDVATGWEIRSFPGSSEAIRCVAFSPNGELLAVGIWEWEKMWGPSGEAVILWRVSDGEEVASLEGPGYARVRALAFSSDGETLAWAESNREVGAWDVAARQILYWDQLRTGNSAAVWSVAFSLDGTLLASGHESNQKTRDPSVVIWDIATGREIRRLTGHSDEPVPAVAFSPDGQLLASGTWVEYEAKVWDVKSGEVILDLPHDKAVYAAVFSPDGTILATGTGRYVGSGEVRLWDVTSGAEIRVLEGHTKSVRSLAFSPDGRFLASGSDDTDVKLLMVETGWVRTLSGHRRSVIGVAFSRDGTRLFSSDARDLMVWDIETGEELSRLAIPATYLDEYTAVAFSPDERFFALSSRYGALKLLDIETANILSAFTGHTSSIRAVAISPDSRLVALGAGARIKLRDVSDVIPDGVGEVAENQEPRHPINQGQRLPDGSLIPVGSVIGDTVLFHATITDPDEDEVELQVELRAALEPFDDTKSGIIVSTGVVSGSEGSCVARELAEGEYHWRARAIDEHGQASGWVEFGENASAATDFIVELPDREAPICVMELREAGGMRPMTSFNVGETFDIFLEHSTDNRGMESVRFASDEDQDEQATGEWTEWHSWATSSLAWDSDTRTKGWSFATPGKKEVWVEVKDGSGNASQCSASVFVHPGYAVLVAGKGRWPDKRGIDHAANNAYRALRNLGFDDNHIVYLNSDNPQDVDDDNDDDVDGDASLNAFKDAIHKVAEAVEGTSTPVLIYLFGHGEQDCFIFDENDSAGGYLWVSEIPGTPGLAELLSEFTESVPCAVVVGSCYSGCFIASSEASPGSISAPDRVVITMAHNDKDRAMVGLVRSSDTLWGDLMDGANLRTAFENRSLPGDTAHLWLDDNGDEIGHPPDRLEDDGSAAAQFRIGVPGSDDLKLKSWVFFWLRSPGELRVYDADERITGVVNGEISEEIPGSLFDVQNNIVVMFDPPDSYYFEVVGTAEGTYNLDGVLVANGKDYAVAAAEMPTLQGVVHRYSVDWSVITQGGEGMTLQVDAQGDGEFEETHQVGQQFSGEVLQPTSTADSDSSVRGIPSWLIASVAAAILLVALLLGVRLRRSRRSS